MCLRHCCTNLCSCLFIMLLSKNKIRSTTWPRSVELYDKWGCPPGHPPPPRASTTLLASSTCPLVQPVGSATPDPEPKTRWRSRDGWLLWTLLGVYPSWTVCLSGPGGRGQGIWELWVGEQTAVAGLLEIREWTGGSVLPSGRWSGERRYSLVRGRMPFDGRNPGKGGGSLLWNNRGGGH